MDEITASQTTFDIPVDTMGCTYNKTVTIYGSGSVSPADALKLSKIVLKAEDIKQAIGGPRPASNVYCLL